MYNKKDIILYIMPPLFL